MFKIAVLPGDGIGREVAPVAVEVLKRVAKAFRFELEFNYGLVSEDAYEKYGHPLPKETMELCRSSQAVILGAVGSPKMDRLPPELRPERAALLPLRKMLGLYCNLRPVKAYPELLKASPLKNELIKDVDLLMVRELTGGLYFGEKYRRTREDGEEIAGDNLEYTKSEIRRILEFAFSAARSRRKKVTSVDKANVLTSSQLWRETARELHEAHPDLELENMYVDNCAMQLVKYPAQFDVLVTENMFGDILSDQASVLAGSLGMLPSASLGGEVALYEPAHGSAPDIAGQGQANPLATILSVAMLCRYSLQSEEAAQAIEQAVGKALAEGYRTPDLMSDGMTLIGTEEMGNLVIKEIEHGNGE